MPLSIHDALVPGWLRILHASHGWLEKARESGIPEAELVEARLIADMLPLAYQVKSMAVHSSGAIEGLRAGSASPDRSEPPRTIAGLGECLDGAIAFLEAVTADELERLADKAMVFTIRDRRLDFTGAGFLLSFSQPNFFFHAVTAYDILRMRGVEIGKRDFLGPAWLQPAPR
jgi:hypothetical protein